MTRKLYLLALFQILGGPLVLLAVLTAGKLVATKIHDQGLKAGMASVCDHGTWQAVADVVAKVDAASHGDRKGTEMPVGQVKEKIIALAWSAPEFVFGEGAELAEVPGSRDLWSSRWPHAPPSPPPRGV